MTERGSGLAPFAPVLVGAVIAVAGMTGAGLLLNQGAGLLRAAVSILALQCAALAAGSWAAEPPSGDTEGEGLRGWWVASLLAMTLAAALSAWWQLRGLPAVPMATGAVFGLLVGLPQVALGGVATRLGQGAASPTLLLAGAAAGFLLSGLVLLPLLAPPTVYFLCVTALAAAAAMHATQVPEAPPAPHAGAVAGFPGGPGGEGP